MKLTFWNLPRPNYITFQNIMTKFSLTISKKHGGMIWMSSKNTFHKPCILELKGKKKKAKQVKKNEEEVHDKFQDEILCFTVPKLWEK